MMQVDGNGLTAQRFGCIVFYVQASKKKCLLVDLLTPKRSQNVAIVLKQFKVRRFEVFASSLFQLACNASLQDLDMIISDLSTNKISHFDVDILRTLTSILPDDEEVLIDSRTFSKHFSL